MKFLGVLFLLLTSWVWSEENTYDETDLNNDYITTEALKKVEIPSIHEKVIPDEEYTEEQAAKELREALERKELIETKAAGLPFVILPHRPNYIMPFAYTETPYEDPYEEVLQEQWPGFNNLEAIFQISLKYQIYKFDKDNKHRLYIAYTNKSYWQVYNSDASRPFRETNHEPELLFQFSPNWGVVNRINLSFNHQSNGQYQGFSRSWNRIIVGMYHLEGNRVYGIEPWWRLPEKDTADPLDPTDDDNPDITNYLGYANFIFFKKWKKYSGLLRFGNNLREKNNRGWGELEFNFPVTPRVRGFIQYYEGYGHSLIEYNQYQRRIGVGFKISDYL